MMQPRSRWSVASIVVVASVWVAGQPAQAEVTLRRLALVTVTDTTATLTWETNRPADTLVRYGTQQNRLDRTTEAGDARVRFHHCELRGLEPGTRYYYVCQSGPAKLGIAPLSPGRFTTLVPPPGPELFRFATMTDTHVGQEWAARLALSSDKVVSEGVRWRDLDVPFWELAVGASIDEINACKAAFTIVKGDLTHSGTDGEFSLAKRLLDRLDRPYHVLRGNHDAIGPLLRTFGLRRSWYSFDHQGFHFVVLDTEAIAHGSAPSLEAQLKWLGDDLASHRRQRTFVFVHRPIPPKLARPTGGVSQSLYKFGRGVLKRGLGPRASSVLDRASGREPAVPPANAARLAGLLRNHGRVVGVFAGHLHRNYVGYWPEQTGNLPYVETASTKEYPCGYAITRVFAAGYMRSYHVPAEVRCLEWSAMTQDAYAKIGFGSKVGHLSDRNFVVRFDQLDLRKRGRESFSHPQKRLPSPFSTSTSPARR